MLYAGIERQSAASRSIARFQEHMTDVTTPFLAVGPTAARSSGLLRNESQAIRRFNQEVMSVRSSRFASYAPPALPVALSELVSCIFRYCRVLKRTSWVTISR